MSTTGIQNYLSNVFRQVYTYDTTTGLFTPKLELSNIDTYSGNAVSVGTAAVGDAASNVYVGSNAGNPYNFIQNDRNVTAVGFGAAGGISNVSNSVYLGFRAGVGQTDANAIIAIGVSAIGGGTSNISIGNGTGTVGTSNILIGHSIVPGVVSNQIRIGMSNEIVIAGNIASKWVGIGGGRNPVDVNNKFDVSGNARIQGALGIFRPPGDRTLDVNGSLRANNGIGASIDVNGTGVIATAGGASMTLSNGLVSFIDASGGNLLLSSAVTRSSRGYSSLMDSAVVSTPLSIFTAGAGIVMVSAFDTNTSVNRASGIFFIYNTGVSFSHTALAIHTNGETVVGISNANPPTVVITTLGAPRTYRYSVTYFPM